MLVGEPDPLFAGEAIPAATLVDPQGGELALAEIGVPVLINLWATWCAPCVTEMPLLNQLAEDYRGRLAVITINEDGRGPEVVTRFFSEHELAELPQWIDADNAVAGHFGGGPGLPLSVLYDTQGREVWRVVGDYAWDSEEARSAIDAALATDAD